MKDALSQNNKFGLERLIFYGFCGLFFFLPVMTSPAVIMGLLTISLWFLSGRFVRDMRASFAHEWAIPVIILISLSWAGLLYTPDLSTGLSFAKKSYYWLYAFAIAGLSVKDHQEIFIKSFLAGLTVSVALAMAQYAGLLPMPKGFMTGFFGGENPYITFSLFLILGLLILSFYYKSASRRSRLLIVILAGAYFFNLAIIPGRSGYLAFILLSPVMLINIVGKKKTVLAVAVSLALVAALFSSSIVQERVKLAVEEVKLYYQGDNTTSIGKRLYMWDGAVRIFLNHPALGVGTGGYKEAMTKYKDNPDFPDMVHPHNSFLYIATNHGAMGLAAFLWLLYAYLKKGWRARHTITGFAVLSFCLITIIGGMTDTQYISLASGNMFALLLGLKTDGGADV